MAHSGEGNDAHIGSETVLSGIITTGYARITIVERITAQHYSEIGACDLGDGMPPGLLMYAFESFMAGHVGPRRLWWPSQGGSTVS